MGASSLASPPHHLSLARASCDLDCAIDQAAEELQGVSETWTEPALSAPHTGAVSVKAVRLPAAYVYASGDKKATASATFGVTRRPRSGVFS